MTNYGVVERLGIDGDLAQEIIVGFIRDEITKSGRTKAVLGLSGGVDSALVAYLAAEAVGRDNILVVRMPYETSAQSSLDDAQLVIEDIGLKCVTIPITPMVKPLLDQLGDIGRVRAGNLMARARMAILYDQSEAFGGLVVGTGNKTEMLIGYSTVYGDTGVAMQPIADLYKTQIWHLSAVMGVPSPILTKQPSADLFPGQSDEDDLGIPYALLDQILYLIVDERYSIEQVVGKGYSQPMVERVWNTVKRNHYKRTMPSVAMLSGRTIGHNFLYLRNP